jgi:hypothetical protein
MPKFMQNALRKSDYALHPPSGSSLPGTRDPNPYIFYPPKDLRDMIPKEQDEEEKAKMLSALKQYERIYTYPGYPWRIARKVAANFLRIAEVPYPSLNIPYYQDIERTQGDIDIWEEHQQGVRDNYDDIRFDYNRQGERPVKDIMDGDYLSPKDAPFEPHIVKERGDGPDPEGMETCEPPTGGETGGI